MTENKDAREREAFEAFWRREMNTREMDLALTAYPMTAPEDQQYLCHETNRAWITWQARAARACALTICWRCGGMRPIDLDLPSHPHIMYDEPEAAEA